VSRDTGIVVTLSVVVAATLLLVVIGVLALAFALDPFAARR
jgi:hypothetical protein